MCGRAAGDLMGEPLRAGIADVYFCGVGLLVGVDGLFEGIGQAGGRKYERLWAVARGGAGTARR